jgi:tRNA(fMet)-specific endonuclease VapC
MIRYILDTNTLTLLQNRHPKVVQRASAVPPDELAITIISVEEQLTGWYTQLRRTNTPDRLARVYDRLTTTVASLAKVQIVSYSEEAIYRFENLRKKKINIGKMDLRIGAITFEMDATIVTQNTADFSRIPGLKIEDWSK